MKRCLFTIAPLLLVAASASAAGMNLGWNDCPGGASYSLIERFACDSNADVHTLVGSFVAPAGIVAMSANEISMDVETSGLALSQWWSFGTGQCRAAASLAGNFDFSTLSACYDYWQAGAIGSLRWSALPPANVCRIKGVFALPVGDSRIVAVPKGLEVYSFKCIINNARSTGLGACSGCSDQACIVLNSIRVNQPLASGGFAIFISNPAVTQFVVWQGWTTMDPRYTCPGTPTRQQTWGSIKALYR